MAPAPKYKPPSGSTNFGLKIPTSRSKGGGISGVAVLLASAGLYLVYVGVKDVAVVDGLRDLIRGKRPTEAAGSSYAGPADIAGAVAGAGPATTGVSSTDGASFGPSGNLGLVGHAAAALPKLRTWFPTLEMGGRAARPDNPTSDHPAGLAIDIMTTNRLLHAAIIQRAIFLPGFKYYCSDLVPGGANCPGNKHRDHVHISFKAGG